MLRVEPKTYTASYIFLPEFEDRHDGWVNVYPWGYATIAYIRFPSDHTVKALYRIRVKWKKGDRNGQ